MGFLDIFGVSEIHRNSEAWEKYVPIIRENYGEKQTFPSYGFLKHFG